jgi:hypothetical protein
VLNLDPIGPPEPLCMMWRSDLPLPPAARQFRDLAMQMLKEDLDLGRDARQGLAKNEARRFETVQRLPRSSRKGGPKSSVAHARVGSVRQ